MNRTRRAILTIALTLAATLALATPAAATDNCDDFSAADALGTPTAWTSYGSFDHTNNGGPLAAGTSYVIVFGAGTTDDGTNPGSVESYQLLLKDNVDANLGVIHIWTSNGTIQTTATSTYDYMPHLVKWANITNMDGDAINDDAAVIAIKVTVPTGGDVARYLGVVRTYTSGNPQLSDTWDGTSTGILGYVTESTATTRRYAYLLAADTDGCATNNTTGGSSTSTGNADSTRIATGVVSTLAQWVPVVVLFTLLGIAMSAIGLSIFGTKKME